MSKNSDVLNINFAAITMSDFGRRNIQSGVNNTVESSVEDARWLLGTVAFLAILVLTAGIAANYFAG